jgi:hypothetical protein
VTPSTTTRNVVFPDLGEQRLDVLRLAANRFVVGWLGIGKSRLEACWPVVYAGEWADGLDIAEQQAHQVRQVGLDQGLGKGDHTLRRFRALDLLDLALADKSHRNVVGPCQRLDLPEDRGRVRTLHHPDFVHSSPAGGEQFPHRLSALDLVAAELTPDLRGTSPTSWFSRTPAPPERLAGSARASPGWQWPLVAACDGRPTTGICARGA